MWDLIVSVPDHCLSFYLLWGSSVRNGFIVFIYGVVFYI